MQLAEMPAGYRLVPLRCATLPPATHINCYVVGFDSAIVVDPGSAFPAELERLRSTLFSLRGGGGTLIAVFLTHHHRDHCGGAAAIAREFDVPILAHRETLERLPFGSRAPGLRLDEVEHQQTLELESGRVLRVLHTPGHAQGHCCLFEQEGGVLLSGDMILGRGTTLIDPADGDMTQYLTSLVRLAEHDPRWILPAHGPPLRQGRDLIERLLQHRLWREERVYECVRARSAAQTTLDVTHCAYGEQAAGPVALMAAYRSTLAHLHKLEVDGKVRCTAAARWASGSPA